MGKQKIYHQNNEIEYAYMNDCNCNKCIINFYLLSEEWTDKDIIKAL